MELCASRVYHSSELGAYSKTPRVPLFIGGRFIQSKTEHWIPVHNPATQELLCLVPQSTPQELQLAADIALQAFKSWKEQSVSARQAVMFKLQELIKRDLDKIAANITDELGKTVPDAKGDVLRGLQVVEHACSIPTLQMGELMEGVATDMDTYSIRQPLGVCAGICPFKFPGNDSAMDFPFDYCHGKYRDYETK